MTMIQELERLFPDAEVREADDWPGEVYEVLRDRGHFGDSIFYVRRLGPDPAFEHLLATDNKMLEQRFYDEATQNPWNIQLFWVYASPEPPPETWRGELEEDTRFAIRRCVPDSQLESFLAPMKTADKAISAVSSQYNRHTLIQSIIDHDLAFLLSDLSNPEAWEALREEDGQGSEAESLPESRGTPPREFVEWVELGDFRERANKRSFAPKDFTVLFGKNASGKTSLLDAICLGMVGQIKWSKSRADDFDGLAVKLKEHSSPLGTESHEVNDRVADWFGFRPKGPAPKYVEFNRVNYLNAGAGVLLVQDKKSVDIGETLRRFLFGEELTAARKQRNWLVKELRSALRKTDEKIEELRSEIGSLREARDRQEEVFSELRAAAGNLSPGSSSILLADDPDADSYAVTDLEFWMEFKKKLEVLKASISAVEHEPGNQPASEWLTEFRATLDSIKSAQIGLNEISDVLRKKNRLSRIEDTLRDHGGDSPVQVAPVLLAMILGSNGVDFDDFEALANLGEDYVPTDRIRGEWQSLEDWRDKLDKTLREDLTLLKERRSSLQEIEDLQARSAELQEEIREKTLEFLTMVDDVHFCPACYVEQDKDAIVHREKPESTDETSDSLPIGLVKEIRTVEAALETVESSSWDHAIDHADMKFSNLWGPSAMQQLWEDKRLRESLRSSWTTANSKDLMTFVDAVEGLQVDPDEPPRAVDVIRRQTERLGRRVTDLSRDIEGLREDGANWEEVEDAILDRRDAIEAGVTILDDYWPSESMEEPLDVTGDLRIIQATLSDLQEETSGLDLSGDVDDQIAELQERLEVLIEEEKPSLEADMDRLESAFGGEGGEQDLEALIREHMAAVSVLFMAFQRPFEFEQVTLDEEGEISVVPRGGGSSQPVSDMSSGQRSALALAIFVANNLAHKSAPRLMLLDEPFVHLDDLNVVSFFNLLLDLAHTGKRQIVFATASRNIADLLRRKAGESARFEIVEVPSTRSENEDQT